MNPKVFEESQALRVPTPPELVLAILLNNISDSKLETLIPSITLQRRHPLSVTVTHKAKSHYLAEGVHANHMVAWLILQNGDKSTIKRLLGASTIATLQTALRAASAVPWRVLHNSPARCQVVEPSAESKPRSVSLEHPRTLEILPTILPSASRVLFGL